MVWPSRNNLSLEENSCLQSSRFRQRPKRSIELHFQFLQCKNLLQFGVIIIYARCCVTVCDHWNFLGTKKREKFIKNTGILSISFFLSFRFIVLYLILPETENCDLEDIELYYSNSAHKLTDRKIRKATARHSVGELEESIPVNVFASDANDVE